MSLDAFIDTDILYKLTRYGLIDAWIQSAPFGANSFLMLAAAPHMVRRKLKKNPPTRGHQQSQNEFEAAARKLIAFEPSTEELSLAAELEFIAQQENLELDGGESQLCAALIMRSKQMMFTGDKRALLAISHLLTKGRFEQLRNKFICLEQTVLQFLNTTDHQTIRSAICTEPNADRAISICFSCATSVFNVSHCEQGLLSYIENIRITAPDVLHPH